MRSVSVIVPARDAEATLPATLAALEAQDYRGEVQVLVVDDVDGRGPAAARNRGATGATGEVLAFTDADCVPAPGWLSAGIAAIEGGAEVVQGRVEPDASVPRGAFDRTLWVTAESGLYETANLLITRELFERLGGFESWLGAETAKELGEDAWLGWRARRAGARTAFAPAALVQHAVFPRRWRAYAAERSRLRFFPALVRRIPELRRELLFARIFLTPRSAAFDLALAGLVATAAARSLLPLIVGAPYAVMAVAKALRHRGRAPQVLAGDLAADAVGLAALVRGSVAARRVVI